MTDFHDKPYHSKSDHAGDPNKPQEGSHKTSFAFVSDIYIYIYMTPVFHFVRDSCSTSFKIEFQDFA